MTNPKDNIKTPCCNVPYTISVSTRWGRRKICNGCGKEYSQPTTAPTSNPKEEYIPTSPRFQLMMCDWCIQMTNHLDGDCQKCQHKNTRFTADSKEPKSDKGDNRIDCEWCVGDTKYGHARDCARATPAPTDKNTWEQIDEVIRDNLTWYKYKGTDHGDLVIAEEAIKSFISNLLSSERFKAYDEGLNENWGGDRVIQLEQARKFGRTEERTKILQGIDAVVARIDSYEKGPFARAFAKGLLTDLKANIINEGKEV